MNSIVIELQRDALDASVTATDLLKKAYVVARKLKVKEFQDWIDLEMKGCIDNSLIPNYREMTGIVKAWNPYHGWQPVYIEDAKLAEKFSKRKTVQSIAEIESLLNSRDNNSTLQIPFDTEQQNIICKAIGFHTQVTLMISHTELVKVADAIRNIILNWAMKLEEDGVLGEGMTFSEVEKKEAAKQSYNVNFYGNVTGTQVQQGSSESVQSIELEEISIDRITQFIKSLLNEISNLEIEENANKELSSEIATVEAQISSPSPKHKIIRESLGTIRRILEGASGAAAAQLLIKLGSLFSS